MNDVKPKRRYRSALRSEQQAETRTAVLEAARDLFVKMGWQKTTIIAIAAQAGVSKETIYASFGNKRTIIEAVISAALRGAQPSVPLLQQGGPRSIATASSQREQLKLFANDITAVLSRVAPLMSVARAAAEGEPELMDLYRQLHEGRRRNLAFVVDALLAHGPLAEERDEALATLWRLASPELYLLMTGIEDLSKPAYAKWLERSLSKILLRHDPQA